MSAPLASWTMPPWSAWREILRERVNVVQHDQQHGDAPRWEAAVQMLPHVTPTHIALNQDIVTIEGEINDAARSELERSLRALCPWRKGPFDILGVRIDTEWRSDWKWQRVVPHLSPLAGRSVLDVGCGSGYHLWRARGAGASRVLGVDPSLLFNMQFAALQHFVHDPNVAMLPLRSEDLPSDMGCFDTVLSMGVIYHRRDPLAHLRELRGALRDGGEFVLETLVIADDGDTVLTPTDRYAQMRNVWAIPSCRAAARWLHEAGFVDVRCVDITPTTIQEQRRTSWMPFESLAAFLDPADPARTLEGYPAPIRAVFVATKG